MAERIIELEDEANAAHDLVTRLQRRVVALQVAFARTLPPDTLTPEYVAMLERIKPYLEGEH